MSTPEQFLCPGGTIYTVRAGDTLFAIAQRFNTTIQAIINANPGIDPNRLVIGQRICIPVPRPGQEMGAEAQTVAETQPAAETPPTE